MDQSETRAYSWEPPVVEFRDFLKKERVTGEHTDEINDFVPAGEIKAYLCEGGRLKEILAALFGSDKYNGWEADQIIHFFSVVFAILVSINKGHHILGFLEHDSLRDNHLPFAARPPRFPEAFFDAFSNAQPRFWAATFTERSLHVFEDERRLPYLEKKRVSVNEGGSADVYRVRIHPNHNELHGSGSQSAVEKQHKYYALKAYRESGGKKSHDIETNAFRNLGRTGLDETHIVGFYCSYVHRKKHYALLEFADRGTLEDFIRKQPPPQTNDEVAAFWSGMLSVIEAIIRLHGPRSNTNNASESSKLVTVHQDIKPQNILVKSKEGGSKYDFVYGIADLGTSSSVTSDSGVGSQDNFGTKTYGNSSPECFRRDPFNDNLHKEITTSADIWSLACVLSEICVWVTFGYWNDHGVEGYRERRKEHNPETTRGSDCFHVNGNASPVVQAEHLKIIEQGNCGRITERVLQTLEWMLEIDPLSRPSADEVRIQFEEAKKDVKGKKAARASTSSRKVSKDADSPLRARQNTMLRNTATQHHRQSSAGYNSSNLYHEVRTASPRRMTGHTERGYAMHDPLNVVAGAVRVLTEDDRAGMFAEPGPAYENRSSQTLPNRNFDQDHQGRTRNPTSPPHSAPGPRRDDSTARQYGRGRLLTSASAPDRHARPKSNPSGTATPSISGDYSVNDRDESSSSPPEVAAYLSMDDALSWRKRSREGATLSDHSLFSQLEKRDHVFVVDNSKSMGHLRATSRQQKQYDIATYVEVLSYMVKDKDPDGINLYYFNSKEEVKKCKKSTQLAGSVAAKTFDGLTTPDFKLKSLLNDYCAELREFANKRRQYERRGPNSFLSLLSRPPVLPRPLSIYVLTDGVWLSPRTEGGDYLKGTIRKLIGQLKELECERDQVGVQFIRFGNHLYGRRRLEALDLLGKHPDLDFDIIDTEPAENGNVWKMLLGAIDSQFDAD